MYSYKLALPLALVWGATATYAYPAAFQNPESPALVARAEHALPSPSMAMSYPVTNTAGRDPHSLNMPRSFEGSNAKLDQKRQIHNADYHADGPPPSPNPASDSSSPSSPTDSPAASPSEIVPKDKRGESSLKHGPGPVRPPSNSQETGRNDQGDIEKSSDMRSIDGRTFAREQKRQIHNADYSNAPPPSPNPAVGQDSSSPPSPSPSPDASSDTAKTKRAVMPREHSVVPSSSSSRENRIQDHPDDHSSSVTMNGRWIDAFDIIPRQHEWYGRSRRDAEELTNTNNRSFDHKAVRRWTRAEAAKMQEWSKGKFAPSAGY
ncbi:hypothetical protein B0H16DRAFT_1537659 [Mycena metata]|uniref:Uncharacterized protein n=1 Tax=Mycena metata TaxID=1033252 RepID=A0AAD7J4J7_9AGAR|nr:hypothetical protein B0H16DRAFT_1537659 [Mycena metata]